MLLVLFAIRTVTVLAITSSPFESNNFTFVTPRISKFVPVIVAVTLSYEPTVICVSDKAIFLTSAGLLTTKVAVFSAGVVLFTITFTV